jgi:hypothetical protein
MALMFHLSCTSLDKLYSVLLLFSLPSIHPLTPSFKVTERFCWAPHDLLPLAPPIHEGMQQSFTDNKYVSRSVPRINTSS